MDIKKEAREAAKEIYEDLCDRRGIGDEIEGCDRGVRKEIRDTITSIIERHMEALKP